MMPESYHRFQHCASKIAHFVEVLYSFYLAQQVNLVLSSLTSLYTSVSKVLKPKNSITH